MLPSFSLTTKQIRTVFVEEVAAHGGQVTDTFDDGRKLFARSVLPEAEEVRRNDHMHNGVALKATQNGVWLYPYLYRLVCKNGAIVAETIAERSVENLHFCDAAEAADSIREGIAACCAPDVFMHNIRRVRTSCEMHADLVLNFLPMLSRLLPSMINTLASEILRQFFNDVDTSQFALANVITAIARDTRDPEVRWDLEELGGGIAVGIVTPQPSDSEHVSPSAWYTEMGVR